MKPGALPQAGSEFSLNFAGDTPAATDRKLVRQAGNSRVFLASSRPKEIPSAPYRNGQVAWHPAVSCHEPPGWVARQSTQVTPAKLGTSVQLVLLKKQKPTCGVCDGYGLGVGVCLGACVGVGVGVGV